MHDTLAQQAFINEIAPGAIATQRKYGVPAAVTIAQAINESGWGQSALATQAHNLFGIKGSGPAGSASMPTQEYENGQWETISAPFRAYHNYAESIEDHGKLLAESGYYTRAMADRNDPDAFANALTGVYATNPEYGTILIQLMHQYNLYSYDVPEQTSPGTAADASGAAAHPSSATARATAGKASGHARSGHTRRTSPGPRKPTPARPEPTATATAPKPTPVSSPTADPTAAPTGTPAPTRTSSGRAARSAATTAPAKTAPAKTAPQKAATPEEAPAKTAPLMAAPQEAAPAPAPVAAPAPAQPRRQPWRRSLSRTPTSTFRWT